MELKGVNMRVGFNMPIDTDVLILGASSIPEEDYLNLANEVGDSLADIYTLVWSRALNPADTAAFVKSIENEPNKDELIYQRAINCIDNAGFIIVDISSASTGMGLEVGYLLANLEKQKKHVAFIAKKGSKISPHITGMYKKVTGNKVCEVCFYLEPKQMVDAVRATAAYDNYKTERDFNNTY